MNNTIRIKAISKWFSEFLTKAKYVDTRTDFWGVDDGNGVEVSSYILTGDTFNGFPESSRVHAKVVKNSKVCRIFVDDRTVFPANITIDVDTDNKEEMLAFDALLLQFNTMFVERNKQIDDILVKNYADR